MSISLYLHLRLGVNFQLTDRHRMGQQAHFTVKKDRPDEANVQQHIQGLVENKIAEKGRAQNMGDDVILMGACILRRPVGHLTWQKQ